MKFHAVIKSIGGIGLEGEGGGRGASDLTAPPGGGAVKPEGPRCTRNTCMPGLINACDFLFRVYVPAK